jgi:cbb3-type cytochrome oxidase subunit 3
MDPVSVKQPVIIVPFATWTFDYLIYSYLLVLLWMAILFGIPLFIGGTLWLYRELKKTL